MTEQGVFTRFDSYDFASDDRFQAGLGRLKQQNQDHDDASWLLSAKLFYYNKFVEPISLRDYLKALDKESQPEHKEDEVILHSDASASPVKDMSDCHLINDASLGDTQRQIGVATNAAARLPVHMEFPTFCQHNIKDEEARGSMSHDLDTRLKLSNGEVVPHAKNSSESSQHMVNNNSFNSFSTTSGDILAGSMEDQAKLLAGDGVASQKPDEHQTEQCLTITQIMDYIQRGERIPGLKQLDVKPTNLQPTESVITKKAKPWENTSFQQELS